MIPEDIIVYSIGHELIHIANDHGSKRVSRVRTAIVVALACLVIVAQCFIIQWWSIALTIVIAAIFLCASCMLLLQHLKRKEELEYDKEGMIPATNAKFNPLGALVMRNVFAFINKCKKIPEENSFQNLFQTHPTGKKRYAVLLQKIEKRSPSLLSHV